MKKGSKVRVLATGKVGTVSDTEFFVLGSRKHIRVEVKFEDKPEPIWYKREELGSIYEDLMVNISDDSGRSIVFDLRYDHSKEEMNMSVQSWPKNIQVLKKTMIGQLAYSFFDKLTAGKEFIYKE